MVFLSIKLVSQTNKLDSLRQALAKSKTDTGKINTWNEIANEYVYTSQDSAEYYANKSKEFSIKIKYKFGEYKAISTLGSTAYLVGKSQEAILFLLKYLPNIEMYAKNDTTFKVQKFLGNYYNVIGNNYFVLGSIDSALVKYKATFKIFSKINYKKGVASTYLNISNIQNVKGDIANALDNLFKSLKITEQINDKKTGAFCYNNIAKIFYEQNEQKKALEFTRKAYKLAVDLKVTSMEATTSYNISTMLMDNKELDEALVYAEKSLKYAKEMNSDINISRSMSILGSIYEAQNKNEKALESLKQALVIAEKTQDFTTLVLTYNIIAKVYQKLNNYKLALLYGEKALAIASNLKSPTDISRSANLLTTVYKKNGDFKKALEMKELAVAMNDSVITQKNQKELMGQEFKYAYGKKSLQDSLSYINQQKITQLENQSKLKVEQNKRITLYVILGLSLVLAAFIFNRFKVTQKQKGLIETQSKRLEIAHLNLEEKTKEVQDSIIYSKEIQNIFLKSITQSENYFNDSILYYKPKAVVSGDFYWYKELNDNLFVVVGDCTGHGVPGAIISVLAIQSLEKVVPFLTSIESLHEINVLMNNEFKQYYSQEKHVSIGLDFSIICLNKPSRKLYLSGSGATILLKNKQNELLVEKFESINIGGVFPHSYQPTTAHYTINNLQSVYLYTDGIVDQKGEQTEKKYSTEQLKNLIAHLNTTSASDAFNKIETALNNWKGNSTQIDDMTLLGIQFN